MMMTKNERKAEKESPLKIWWAGFWREKAGPESRSQRYFLLFLLTFFLTWVIIPKGGFAPIHYTPGDVASRDVKAPVEMLIPDEGLTVKKRREAADAVRPLYDYDARAGIELENKLIQILRLVAAESVPGEKNFETLAQQVTVLLGDSLSIEEIRWLDGLPKTPEFIEAVRTAINAVLRSKIVTNSRLFSADVERGVVLRNLQSQQEDVVKGGDGILDLASAQTLLQERLTQIDGLSRVQKQTLITVCQRILRPNLTFNKNETESRKQQALEAVAPVLFQVKKGEMIVREGERVTVEQIQELRALSELGNEPGNQRTAVGMFICISLLFFIMHRFAGRNIRKYNPGNRDILFLTVVLAGLFVLIKVSIFVSTALEGTLPAIDGASYYYAIPFAAGAMLVRIVLNSEIALFFTLSVALLAGVLFGNSLLITLYVFLGSLVGAHGVRQCKQRTTLYRAGLILSLANVSLVLGLHLLSGRGFEVQLLYKLGFALGNGLVCAVIVNGTVPLVEYLFKYTTDVKLLELANMNTPILRELMIQAPGTYHHSIIVGNLVEAAAEKINANPLLARVAAYYHDIGKIKKPLYFVENIRGGENRHDRLAPSMSALILISHVKDGAEMAREIKLGEALVDIIRQHQGTALIKFFYEKAKTQAGTDMPAINEQDYRYPGPKPQTREAALIMLADAVEAASRTLADPTPARIQGMVQKIINNIFNDGQLNECELTLKDLHNIAKSFNQILGGIFHQRIDYPEPAFKERDKDATRKKNGDDTPREPTKEAQDTDVTAEAGRKEDLKRLGMS